MEITQRHKLKFYCIYNIKGGVVKQISFFEKHESF